MDEELVPWFFYIDNKSSELNQIPIPTLRVLHKYPTLLPRFQVDKGAIPFVLRGSDIFCQGLTSKGGNMVDVEKDRIVGIFAETKQHACAIGVTTMSTQNMLCNRFIFVCFFGWFEIGLNHMHFVLFNFIEVKRTKESV